MEEEVEAEVESNSSLDSMSSEIENEASDPRSPKGLGNGGLLSTGVEAQTS
jgi:hypothetical protein